MMSTIRMIRSRVPAARCWRSHSSGTKTYGRAATTSSPAIPTSMRGSPCGSGATVVSANVNVQSVRAFSFDEVRRHLLDLPACHIETEPFGQRP